MAQLEQHLGQARDTGRRLQVADVGLHRADGDRRPFGPFRGVDAPAEGLHEPGDLDGVTERGPGAVGLHVADGGRVGLGAAQGGADHLGLRGRARHRVTAGLAARVDGGAADDAEDAVTVGDRVLQGPQQYGAHALAGDESVGVRTEAPEPVTARDHSAVGQHAQVHGVQDQVDAAGDRGVALPRPDALAGQVDRGERGGAGRVDGEARAGEVEGVRDPVGDRPVVGVGVGTDAEGGGLATHPLVVVVHDADEDADRAAGGQRGGRVAGVVQDGRGGLQEQPPLRVHRLGVGR